MEQIKRVKLEIVGVVVSDKMDKTRIIQISKSKNHRLYQKGMSRHRKYFVHDEKNVSQKGDLVRAVSSRPLSKLKHFRMAEVVENRSIA